VRALVEKRLADKTIKVMRELEDESTRLGQRSLWLAVISVIATFGAVFLAVWLESRISERATRGGVEHVLRVAVDEAKRSHEALDAVPVEGLRWEQAPQDLRRTMLDPLPALGTLLDDERFLERGDPKIVAELLSLNRAVSVPLWSGDPGARKSGGAYFVPPALDQLQAHVARVEDLLRKQLEEW